MMRVRMKTSMAGADFLYKRGQEVELEDRVALRLLASEQAEHVIPATAGGPSKDWPLGILPAEYLRRFPTGPNADLARQVLAGHAVVETR